MLEIVDYLKTEHWVDASTVFSFRDQKFVSETKNSQLSLYIVCEDIVIWLIPTNWEFSLSGLKELENLNIPY